MSDLIEGVRYLVNRESHLEEELERIRQALAPIRATVASMGSPRPVATVDQVNPPPQIPAPKQTKIEQLRSWIDARDVPFRAGDIEIDGIPKAQMASYLAAARRMGHCERVAVGLYRRPTKRANREAAS